MNSKNKPNKNKQNDKLVDQPTDPPDSNVNDNTSTQYSTPVNNSILNNETTALEKDKIDKQNIRKLFILDPLSVIIKLSIISYKPSGTKISICNNLVGIQEIGIFQPIVRFFLQNTKEDLHFLYNPIELACKYFLSDTMIAKMPKIIHLFECALNGISKLEQTYKNSPTIILCLNYYSNIILNYLHKLNNINLFKKDAMTEQYTDQIINKLVTRWTDIKLQVVLDLNEYLIKNDNSEDNLNCFEMFMKDFDTKMQNIIFEFCNDKLNHSIDSISI